MYLKLFCAIVLLILNDKSVLGQESVSQTAKVEIQNAAIENATETDVIQNTTAVSDQIPTSTIATVVVPQNDTNPVSDSFLANEIVPKYIPVAPSTIANVTFSNGANANLGKELTPSVVKDAPKVSWNGVDGQYYSLIMIDPDVPSRANPILAEFLQWQVVNIRGDDLTSGDVIAPYVGAGPPKNSGLHRYVILVFQQPSEISFNMTRLKITSFTERTGFSTIKFVKKYNLGDPVAGNIFVAKYDKYVPILHKQLGISGARNNQPMCLVLYGLVGLSFVKFFM